MNFVEVKPEEGRMPHRERLSTNAKGIMGMKMSKKQMMFNRQMSSQYDMQTEVNYDLLSRSDSMKRMTIRNMDSDL